MSRAEIIVRFRAGVPEDEARSAVEGLGGQVRRRMRDDHPDIVTLIVGGDDEVMKRAAAELGSDGRVDLVEDNAGGFRALDD